MFVTLDESGINKGSPWMAFGALWVPQDSLVPEFEAQVTRIRQRHRCWAEFKWSELDGQYENAYLDFLEAVLRLDRTTFTVMVKETATIDEKKVREYNGDGGRSLAYLKFMRRLIQHRIGRGVAAGQREFTLLYDDVSGKGEIKEDFAKYLRNDLATAAQQHGASGCRFAQISKASSKIVHLIQAVDLLTGASCAAWCRAQSHNPKKAEARQKVIERIEAWRGAALTVENQRGPMDVWRHVWPASP